MKVIKVGSTIQIELRNGRKVWGKIEEIKDNGKIIVDLGAGQTCWIREDDVLDVL